ncbi:uncharacterized protein LOC124655713 [Lolium rigidum]|uniref:uncharacterized protein LOC124655713 n=1 Tax=Lolium rigidum TaxID=89674 RepID=UPI001F5CDE5A|nr:uncharacterized protein LOC124655713 [Lolium rigidum]
MPPVAALKPHVTYPRVPALGDNGVCMAGGIVTDEAEASIVAKTEELKSKDGGIETLETVVGEMSQNIATLQSEIASLQSKRSAAAEEQAGKAKARAIELQNQIEKLKNDIAAQNNKKATMEARASDAEKKVQELNAKLERLQKTSAEQKRRVQKTQHALKVAEEELMRVQLETTTKSEQLGEVHGAWLPPWLATHAARSMELMSSQWNEHGKPAFNSLLQKASEKSVQVKEWAKPHIHTAKTKWIPVIKEKWAIAKTNTEPYMQMVSAKSVEVYQASRDAISPHVLKAHQFANPYFQEAKKLSKPYIDQVAKASKPHVKKLETTLKPYSKKFLETATLYHEQFGVQEITPATTDALNSWLLTAAAGTRANSKGISLLIANRTAGESGISDMTAFSIARGQFEPVVDGIMPEVKLWKVAGAKALRS